MQHSTTQSFVDGLLTSVASARPSAIEAARALVLDAMGIAVAGADTVEGRTVLATVRSLGRLGGSPVPLAEDRFDVASAALVTGTMAYSIGLTDTHAQSITHPGSSVVPVALAVGQETGASDAEILRAILLGVEAIVRIGGVVNPSHRSRGFHPTATCNPFGTALTAATLLGLDKDKTLSALGIAGSMSGGLYEFRHAGSMLMALHGGWPAQSGTTAAYLAREGFTGPHTVLEGPEGFFRGFADQARMGQLTVPEPGEPWGVEELSLRPYNACRYAHSGIDAIAAIDAEHGRVPRNRVRSLTVWTHRTAVEQESEPNTLVAARLSTAFTIALTFLYGPRLGEMTEDDLADPAVRALLPRVEIKEDPRLTELFPRQWACRVDITLDDGTVLSAEVTTPKGEPTNPLTRAEQIDKFVRLVEPRLGTEATRAVVGTILDGTAPLSATVELLAPSFARAGGN